MANLEDWPGGLNEVINPGVHLGKGAGRIMGPSARLIVELNIQHYRELLKTETNPTKRRTIAKLLAEEEARLAKLSAEQRLRKRPDEVC